MVSAALCGPYIGRTYCSGAATPLDRASLPFRFRRERVDDVALLGVVGEQDRAVASGVASRADLIANALTFSGVRHQPTPHPRLRRGIACRTQEPADLSGIGPVRHRAQQVDEPLRGPLRPALQHALAR